MQTFQRTAEPPRRTLLDSGHLTVAATPKRGPTDDVPRQNDHARTSTTRAWWTVAIHRRFRCALAPTAGQCGDYQYLPLVEPASGLVRPYEKRASPAQPGRDSTPHAVAARPSSLP